MIKKIEFSIVIRTSLLVFRSIQCKDLLKLGHELKRSASVS
jgi:hypothetical protein